AAAQEAFQALIAASPDAPPLAQWVLMVKGQRWRDKNPEMALALAKMNATLYPTAFSVYFDLAMAYWQTGNTELARQALDQSLALNPSNAMALNQKAKWHALQQPLRFHPEGTYELFARIPAEETRKEVKFMLRLHEVSGKYQGEIKMIPDIR